jgi:branched-chain amino acid transport system permease protein
MVIIGGAANNAGVALGAFSFTFLFKIVDQVKFYFQGSIPFDVNWLEYLMFASLLILILAFRPGGILPEKSSVTLPWRTVAEIMRPKSKIVASSNQQQTSPEPERADQTDEPGSPPTT